MHPFDREKNFSATGIVGSSLPVALGMLTPSGSRENQNVAVGVVGEGGANAGTFHECMNIAAAWNLPFVILVENNNYAISVPFEEVSATSTIAERAGAFGAPGECVDGTNVETVASAFAEQQSMRDPARAQRFLRLIASGFVATMRGITTVIGTRQK